VLILGVFGIASWAAGAGSFIHPGMLQTRKDLEFMKQKIAAGEEPWKTAWSNLCSESYSALNFVPKPVAHVVRGPYGRPSIGDKELTESANAACSQALQWVVTGGKVHAQKAIKILNAWSGTLWDFEDNDAKLLAGWTGHAFCNAAEILRYTDSGWKNKDVAQFERMLLTVYYPLIKDYFPESNETARNARNGIHVTGSHDVRICENLAEGNDHDGIAANALMDGCHEIKISGNLSGNNGDHGIEVDHATGGLVEDNSVFDNGNVRQQSVTASKAIHLSRTKFSDN
jgi:parallel beta-helix repeat protein